MKIGDRIKSRRKELGLSVDDLAAALGKNRATVYRYENNEIENIPTALLEPLSVILDASPAYIMGWSQDLHSSGRENFALTPPAADVPTEELITQLDGEKYEPTFQIPILGHVAAGIPKYAEQNIEGYTYAHLPQSSNYFALRVKGDSMTAARIYDKDVIVIREQESVENGEIAVVLVNEDEATVKKFYRDGTTVTLMPCSFNPVHEPQVYDITKENIRVIGKVVLNQVTF